MLAFLRQSPQEINDVVRARRVRRGPQARRCGVGLHLGFGIGVDLGIANADGHIHHLTQGRVAIGRAGHLRQPGHYRRARVQHPLVGQCRRQQPGERFRHRHGMVRHVRCQSASIGLVDHLAAMQHDQPICEVHVHRLAPGHGVAILGGECHRIEVVAQVIPKGCRCAGSTSDDRGGPQFSLMTETPAMVWKTSTGPIGDALDPVRGRRKTLHHTADDRVAGFCVEKFTHDRSLGRCLPHPIRIPSHVQAAD